MPMTTRHTPTYCCKRGVINRLPIALQRNTKRNIMVGSGRVVREVLSREQRTKLDVADDRTFYAFPRFVKHVDDTFLAQVSEVYRQRIPDGAAVLDLMSSWVSHLPREKRYARVVGHGLNAVELRKNPQLDTFFVRNLNAEPDGWAFEDQSFDAVVCCVSVQYMQKPERVFAEVYRVLKPGGCCIITFSNRMFPDKAIAAWRNNDSGYGRCQLVKSYFQAVEGFTQPEVVLKVDAPKSPSILGSAVQALQRVFMSAVEDPFYAVIAYRNFKREDTPAS